MDREAAARAIAETAKRTRKPLPRGLWIVAIVVAVVCVGALAIAWFGQDGSAAVTAHAVRPGVPLSHAPPGMDVPAHITIGGGFGIGLLIGVGAGIVIGSLIALRRRDSTAGQR